MSHQPTPDGPGEHTYTRQELLEARERPPLRPEDLQLRLTRRYGGRPPSPTGGLGRTVKHGTHAGYNSRCRCELCREAERAYQRERYHRSGREARRRRARAA